MKLKMRKVILKQPGGKPVGIYIDNSKSLESLQGLVGGLIEVVQHPSFTIWINEEGLLLNLQQNLCGYIRQGPFKGEVFRLFGPIVIDGLPDEEGDTAELTEAQEEEALDWFARYAAEAGKVDAHE